jgi:hypothetical protein
MAVRQGMRLHKSRRRDPMALDYGVYSLVNARKRVICSGALDAIEAFLRDESRLEFRR